MKKFGFVALLALAFMAAAYADDAAPAKGDHPCAQIEKSCKAAGFARGKVKEKKGLFANCMKPILDGQTVEGVTADAATIQGCKDMRAKHHHHGDHAAHDGGAAPAAGGGSGSGDAKAQ